MWSLGAIISFVCNDATHLFRNRGAVLAWPGGKSTLDRNKYSITLRQLTADLLNPNAGLRPSAKKVYDASAAFPLQEEPENTHCTLM